MRAERVVIVGCGAAAEFLHTPPLRRLEAEGAVTVAGVFDPSAERRAALLQYFPSAHALDSLNGIGADAFDLALVLSPVQFHAQQSQLLLGKGLHVLCEKPLAKSIDEAEAMLQAAETAQRRLYAGLIRRHYPAIRALADLVRARALGKVTGFSHHESGREGWPARSRGLFDPALAGGGVLMDVGVHVLDVLAFCFGAPEILHYADDTMGGIESNCDITVRCESANGHVRLSRECPLDNRLHVRFERGEARWSVSSATALEVSFAGAPFSLLGDVTRVHENPYYLQLRAFLSGSDDYATARAAIVAQRAVSDCYAHRKLIEMPWLSPAERERAAQLSPASR